MQTVIALVAFIALTFCNGYRIYRSKEQSVKSDSQKLNCGVKPNSATSYLQAGESSKGRVAFWLRCLSDFHKTQCFYAFALQIASFVSVYGKNRNLWDDLYLLLISADGLLPVAVTLCTLLLLDYAQCYDVILAALSLSLASATGFSIVLGSSSAPSAGTDMGPASCGYRSPGWICSWSVDSVSDGHAKNFFVGAATTLDVLMGVMIMRYCLFRSEHTPRILWSFRFFSKKVRTIVPAFHGLIILSLLVFSAIELYFVYFVLEPSNNVLPRDWSFGQIVGIAIWSAFIFDLIRYEICTCGPPFISNHFLSGGVTCIVRMTH